ncbi:MAG TPA: hypothetical protein VFD89_04825 [Clostridia bacterium]|nr:hypothetical protein [Clostridia bacterium]
MKARLEKYINRKFLLYPKTRDIVEVRDELYSIVLDRYNDCLNLGMSEGASYKMAIEIMADYREALKEVEKGSSLGALKRNLIGLIFFSSFYFITLTLIYLFVSMVVLKTFEKTWLIAVGGSFIYLVYFSASTYGYARLFNFKRLERWGVALIYAGLIPIFYVFPSLYLSAVHSKSIWEHSWIIALILVFLYIMTDYLLNRKNISTFQRQVQLLTAGLMLTTISYLLVSIRFGLWDVAWILYVVYLAAASLTFYVRRKWGKFDE